MIFKSKISKRFQDIIMQVMGLAVMFIGASGALRGIFTVKDGFLETGGTMLMIASLTIGALLGELINIEAQMERFGEWLKEKAKSSGDTKFVEGFVTASLTVCIGAMAIVGSIEDGISGNHDTLFAKAVLDLVIVMVCVAFSAIPVAILQGTVTICAGVARQIKTKFFNKFKFYSRISPQNMQRTNIKNTLLKTSYKPHLRLLKMPLNAVFIHPLRCSISVIYLQTALPTFS